jgi:MFS transporter, DHA2 family, multidrug resistance protein
MSTATESPPMSGRSGSEPALKPPVNHWIVALTVTLATFMEVLDTSIANVALPYIAGGMSVGKSQSTWILTSYLVANAIVLPLSGWLIGMLGRKRFYMGCVFLFTVASVCCGAAPTIEILILCRVLQGLAGGGLQPSEQGILVDTFPKAQLGMAMAIYGVAVVVAPILGPTLGGWITNNYSWRWIFYINVPVGIVSLILTHFIVEDPPEMDARVKATRAKGLSIDYIGLSLISLGLGSLEVIYAKGQEWDWYNDPFWRAQFFMISAAVGLTCFLIWEWHHPNPIVNIRLMTERNFAACGIIIYTSFAVLYGANVLLPQMLQELFGYDALRAGLIMSPGAFFTMAIMPVVGFLIGKRLDSRFIIPVGLVALSVASYWMGHYTMNASPWSLNLPRCLMMGGVGCLFVPLNNAAYQYLPKDQINNATGLFNMLRNEGGSLGIAIASTMVDRRAQFHQSRLAEHVTPSNPMVDRWSDYYSQIRMIRGGLTQFVADQQGFALMSRMVSQQARFMAYMDIYFIFAAMSLVALPFVFLMKKAAGKGEIAVH